MAHNHYTPVDVARALARHAPRQLSSILEPAVGSGILLAPLKHRLQQSDSKVVCIEKDPKALIQLDWMRNAFGPKNLEVVCADFLIWSGRKVARERRFDCIVMNPPFAAKRARFVECDCTADSPEQGTEVRRMSIEAAFMVKAIRLLNPGGRLLAILPSSVVSSFSASWLRRYLSAAGAVRYVHELPRFTFPSISARIYLFVFEKHGKNRPVILMNHDLAQPERLQVSATDLAPEFRFDYGYHRARLTLRKLREKKDIEWLALGKTANILRGAIASPQGVRRAIHTTNYSNGFWTKQAGPNRLIKGAPDRRVKQTDLLLKRVGRNCSSTLGTVTDAHGYASSDCITILRPLKPEESLKLFFATRIILASKLGAALMERGTGASYVTTEQLSHLQIPINLAAVYRNLFLEYELAVQSERFSEMIRIEDHVRKELFFAHAPSKLPRVGSLSTESGDV
jgi:tRNA1(Val) A37 N6-methylase TrmN6